MIKYVFNLKVFYTKTAIKFIKSMNLRMIHFRFILKLKCNFFAMIESFVKYPTLTLLIIFSG